MLMDVWIDGFFLFYTVNSRQWWNKSTLFPRLSFNLLSAFSPLNTVRLGQR
jgi:hypothetical protein